MVTELELIPIKEDWDAQPHINEKRGHHVRRENEHKLLIDFILRRSEGSLLVSGKRGVGKSSTIFSAIQECKKKPKGEKILPILVLAPNFEISSKEMTSIDGFEKFKKLILQTLIRRLYKPTSNSFNKELRSEVQILYEKAVAKEVIQEVKDSSLSSKTVNVIESTKFFINPKTLGILLSFAVGGVLFTLFPIAQIEQVQTAIGLGISSVPTLIYTFQKSKEKSTVSTNKKESVDYYKYDYSLSNLHSDFEEVLRKISKDHKIVFIIDELDKMQPNEVIDVLKMLKSLITQGNAIYIFVTGFEFFAQLEQSSKSRPPEYTLFTHRVFLQRPLFHEMEKFIDEIISDDHLEQIKDTPSYNDFKNYVCYSSKLDFFDLNQVLRDQIKDYDKQGRPQINIVLDKQDIILARLQKAMGQIYSRKSYSKPSDWMKNDRLLEKMYWFLDKITSLNPSSEITLGRNGTLALTFPDGKTETITDEIEASTISDLIDHLTRLGYLDFNQNKIRIIGTIGEVPSKPTEIVSREEKQLITAGEKFQELAVMYYNMVEE